MIDTIEVNYLTKQHESFGIIVLYPDRVED